MATCDPNELLAEGKCFGCLTIQQLEVVEAQLLCNLLQAIDPMATCDVNELLAEGRCFGCLTSYQLRQVQAQLLCNIAAVIGPVPPGSAGVLLADTLIDLRAIPSAVTNQVAVLSGDLVAGDGFGGIYIWRTSGAADNPLVTVRPDDYGTQLWEKLL